MNLAEYAIKKKTVTLVFTVAAVIAGIHAYDTMGRLEDPEYTIKEAQIVAVYPGATAKEVEQEVANEIEKAIQELGELDYVESTSYRGSCVVKVVIDMTYDSSQLPQIWDEMRRKVQKAEANLPPGARVALVDDDFGDVYGVYLALHGEGYSYRELKEVANMLRRELLLVQDVSKIALSGFQPEAIYVEMNRDQMAALGITQDQIYASLQAKNMVVDAGRVRVGDDYIAFEPSGGYVTQEGFESLLISEPGAPQLIYLGDVATVVRDYVDPPVNIIRTSRKAFLLDGLPVADPNLANTLTPDMPGVTEELETGMPSICLAISTVSGGNVVVMGDALEKRFLELLPQIPVGIDGTMIYDQPKQVTAAVDGFVINLVEAIVIVIVVLLLFMGLKSGLLIGAILFITIIASFIFMKSSGVLLERISLGALVIALGMLVDNAIVITDGMKMKIEAGIDKIQAAREVVDQNQIPLLGATVVAILAFGAIGLSSDSTGEYCRSLFTVVLISLLMSWVTAVTVTPLFCIALFKKKEQKGGAKDPYGGAFFRAYRSFLELAIKLRYLAILCVVGLFAASLWGFGMLVNSFFPASTQPQFYVDVWMPEGSDIRHTEATMAELEEHVIEYDNVKSAVSVGGYVTRFMLTYAAENPNPAYGQMIVTVHDYQQMDETRRSIERWAEEHLPDAMVYSMRFVVGTGGAGKIQARVSGPDHAEVRRIAEEAQDILLDHPGTLYARNDWRDRVKVVRPVIGEAQARRSGITRPMVAQRLKASFDGITTGYLREGEREQEDRLIPIISRPPLKERIDVDSMRDLQIESPTANQMIPLRQVVQGFETVFEDQIIWRRDRSPTVTVFADPSEGEASQLFAAVRPAIEAIPLPPGYKIEWGGEYEDSGDAQAGLAASIPGFLGMMILMVIMLFNNLRQPLIIWLTVPLALIGVVAGLLFFNQPFGFMALLGALSLTGMLIKNAVVLIDQININIEEKMSQYEAVVSAGVTRMRPVMMAALTTVLGMVPLLGDDFFVAMAVTIMVGLSFATVLTLVFVPVLYATLYGLKPEPN